MILACLIEGIVGIYAQKKLNELDKETGTQDWDNSVQEIKNTFSNKTKVVKFTNSGLSFLFYSHFHFVSLLFYF